MRRRGKGTKDKQLRRGFLGRNCLLSTMIGLRLVARENTEAEGLSPLVHMIMICLFLSWSVGVLIYSCACLEVGSRRKGHTRISIF